MGSYVVTGAGMVGSWVARELTDLGHRVTLFDVAPPMQALSHWVDLDRVGLVRGDLQSLPEILNVVQEASPDAVLHTAGFLTAGVRERPYAGIQVNFMGTVNVLEAARIFGVPRVVFCSSGTVYTGIPDGLAMGRNEDFAMRVISQRPKGLYAVCKLAGEHIGYTYHDLYGMEFAAVRFGGVYGPWQGAVSGLPGRFVRKAVEPLIQGRVGEFDRAGMPGAAYGLERATINLAYARDCAHGVVLAGTVPGDVTGGYDIASGDVSISDFVAALKTAFPGAELTGVPDVPAMPSPPPGFTAAKQKLGYEPQYPIARALQDYAEWARRWLV